MKYVRRTLKLFALSSIALTGIMCSQKSDTESDADAYFASRYQDDIKPACGLAAQKIRECRKVRNTCWDKAHNTYLDTGKSEAIDACFDEYLSCIDLMPEVCELKTIKAFALAASGNYKGDLDDLAPDLAWDGAGGTLGGVEMADKRCQAVADKNKISGKFKAFLSSSKRDFYKEMPPQFYDLPLENVHGTVLSGNIVTLNDIRDVSKNTTDGMWDTIMFFKANKERIKRYQAVPNPGSACEMNTGSTFEAHTGMLPDGSPRKDNCDDWTDNNSSSETTILFDRGGSNSPVEPITNTRWEVCQPGSLDQYAKYIGDSSVLSTKVSNWEIACTQRLDGLFCVQVEK